MLTIKGIRAIALSRLMRSALVTGRARAPSLQRLQTIEYLGTRSLFFLLPRDGTAQACRADPEQGKEDRRQWS